MSIVDFLTARLNEDERSARDVESSVGAERAGDPYSDGSGTANHDAFPSYPWGAEEGELEFMAGPGHPARVLAEVAAKRAIIEMHRCIDNNGDAPCCHLCEYGAAGDDENPYITSGSGRVWPCRTLRLLALPYDSHVDYLPEWKPDSADGTR